MSRRKISVLVVSLLTIGAVGIASPAFAANGVNVEGWCQTQTVNGHWWGNDAVVAFPLNDSALSWRCVNNTTQQITAVDMNAACAYTYPGHPGSAHVANMNDPYSWYCTF